MKTRMKRRYFIHATKIRFRKPRQGDPRGKQEPIVLERSARLNLGPESEKPRHRVSNADRTVFANPESFCDKFIIG